MPNYNCTSYCDFHIERFLLWCSSRYNIEIKINNSLYIRLGNTLMGQCKEDENNKSATDYSLLHFALTHRPGPSFNVKIVFPDMGISIMKIRRLWDSLSFIMEILLLIRWYFDIETAPWRPFQYCIKCCIVKFHAILKLQDWLIKDWPALKFDRQLSSSAAEMPFKFQCNQKIFNYQSHGFETWEILR